MIVVIPTNRVINLSYLEPLIAHGVRFVVVDDSDGRIKINHPQFEVYNWADRRRILGLLDLGFPRRNGASRDFGFYIAWKNSDADEIIVTLDDDCEVYHQDFFGQVKQTLSYREVPTATCDGIHLNILDLYEQIPDGLFPRGFPYSSRVDYQGMRIQSAETRQVSFCLGLWKNVFDINAIDKISGPQFVHPNATLKVPSVVVEKGKLVSVCSMNMQFRRHLIPAVYQLPMHVEVMPHWVVDRYGDIWGGFILKTLMDLRNEAMAIGEPMITHRKDGNHLKNIWQEHVCHILNDEFLDLLSQAKEMIQPDSYLEMMKQLNEGFKKSKDSASPMFKPYLEHMCTAIDAWCEALS
jgi:reversibly glycosylated polypeptide